MTGGTRSISGAQSNDGGVYMYCGHVMLDFAEGQSLFGHTFTIFHLTVKTVKNYAP